MVHCQTNRTLHLFAGKRFEIQISVLSTYDLLLFPFIICKNEHNVRQGTLLEQSSLWFCLIELQLSKKERHELFRHRTQNYNHSSETSCLHSLSHSVGLHTLNTSHNSSLKYGFLKLQKREIYEDAPSNKTSAIIRFCSYSYKKNMNNVYLFYQIYILFYSTSVSLMLPTVVISNLDCRKLPSGLPLSNLGSSVYKIFINCHIKVHANIWWISPCLSHIGPLISIRLNPLIPLISFPLMFLLCPYLPPPSLFTIALLFS